MKPRISRRLELLVLIGVVLSMAVAFMPYRPPAEPSVGPPDTAVTDLMRLRVAVKTRLAAEVAAGKRSLFETAAIFEALDELPSAPLPLTIEEAKLPASVRACRHVIEWVGARFDGSDGAVIVARLKSELQSALEQPGGLQLPDSSAVASIEDLLESAREERREIKAGMR
jgi:hypothetical protein